MQCNELMGTGPCVTTFFHSKKLNTVEGLVSDNLGNLKKEVVTRAGHL